MKLEKLEKEIGKDLLWYREVTTSTNDIAREMGKKGAKNGTLFLAEEQTAGRGTNHRKWCTGKGENIAMSLLFMPKCLANELEGLTYDVATCIVDSIYELTGKLCEIKLPNDIMWHDKKVGGILTEMTSFGNQIMHLVIGIGLNINQRTFPPEIKKIATSVSLLTNMAWKREDFIIMIYQKIKAMLPKYFETDCSE